MQQDFNSKKMKESIQSQAADIAELFDPNRVARETIEACIQNDAEGQKKREELQKLFNKYKENLRQLNNLSKDTPEVEPYLYRTKKTFFNHRVDVQELLRSQHLYKLLHDNKYTISKNSVPFSIEFEVGLEKTLAICTQNKEIRGRLSRWTLRHLNTLHSIRKQLQHEQLKLNQTVVQKYTLTHESVQKLIQNADSAIMEQENLFRLLNQEKFFKNNRAYVRDNLPEMSIQWAASVIVEKTRDKIMKNFEYLSPAYLKIYLNDRANRMRICRKLKKLSIICQTLPLALQLLSLKKSRIGGSNGGEGVGGGGGGGGGNSGVEEHVEDGNRRKGQKYNRRHSNSDSQNPQQKQHEDSNASTSTHQLFMAQYCLKEQYILAKDLEEIKVFVEKKARLLDVNESVEADSGCKILFAIDKKFQNCVQEQNDFYLQFYPYSISSPFTGEDKKRQQQGKGEWQEPGQQQEQQKGNSMRQNQEALLSKLELDKHQHKYIRVRCCNPYIHNLNVLPEKEVEQREQEVILSMYDDTMVNSWFKFLLQNDLSMITVRMQKELTLMLEKVKHLQRRQLQQQQIAQSGVVGMISELPDAFFEFYGRYLKLLYVRSRNSVAQIISHLNYFRSVQKNLNSLFLEDSISADVEGFLPDTAVTKSGSFYPAGPLEQQNNLYNHNKQERRLDDKFFYSNPSLAHVGKTSKLMKHADVEEFIKLYGEAKIVDDQPHVLYEEERFEMEGGMVHLFDHNNVKVMYDAAVHDFFEMVKKIEQICSFFFNFDSSLHKSFSNGVSDPQQQQYQNPKDDIFLDNLDREGLIDDILSLEKTFSFSKVKLVMQITEILKHCFDPRLRTQLVQLITQIMARRPRVSLFKQRVFESYNYEIDNLEKLTQLLHVLFQDLQSEEKKSFIYSNKLQQHQQVFSKTNQFYQELLMRDSCYIQPVFNTDQIAKLLIKLESTRKAMSDSILSIRTDPRQHVETTLHWENQFIQKMLNYALRIVYEGEGLNIFPDYQDFSAIFENSTELDAPDCFNLVEYRLQQHLDEKCSKMERTNADFDLFSVLEYLKLRKKFQKWIYQLAILMGVFREQVAFMGPDFQYYFEVNTMEASSLLTGGVNKQQAGNEVGAQQGVGGVAQGNSNVNASFNQPVQQQQIQGMATAIGGNGPCETYINYTRHFLECDSQVPLGKEISALFSSEGWPGSVIDKKRVVEATVLLEALVLSVNLIQNCVIVNNTYFSSVREQFERSYPAKLANSKQYFSSPFDLKKSISLKSHTAVLRRELYRKQRRDLKNSLQQRLKQDENGQSNGGYDQQMPQTQQQQKKTEISTTTPHKSAFFQQQQQSQLQSQQQQQQQQILTKSPRISPSKSQALQAQTRKEVEQPKGQVLPQMKHRFFNYDNLELSQCEKQAAIKKLALKNPNVHRQAVAEFTVHFKREVHFELLKGLTILQLVQLQRMIRKLPFEVKLVEFNPLEPLQQQQQKKQSHKPPQPQGQTRMMPTQSSSRSVLNLEEPPTWEHAGKIFFDVMGYATNFNMLPSIENVIEMGHEEFEQLLKKYNVIMESGGTQQMPETEEEIAATTTTAPGAAVANLAIGQTGQKKMSSTSIELLQKQPPKKANGDNLSDSAGDLEDLDDEPEDLDYLKARQSKADQEWEKEYSVGGPQWLRLQQRKLENNQCLFLPNDNSGFSKLSKKLKMFRIRDFFSNRKELLYISKSQLFVLQKSLDSLINILSLHTFLSSLEATQEDVVFFHAGLLGTEFLKIHAFVKQGDYDFSSKLEREQQRLMQQNAQVQALKRNELRLRRDLASVQTLYQQILTAIKQIKENKEIVHTNEGVLSFLEKLQNRQYLQVLNLLLQQLHVARLTADETLHDKVSHLLRSICFAGGRAMQLLVRDPLDGQVRLVNEVAQLSIDFDETALQDLSSDFLRTPEKTMFRPASDFMNVIRRVFWDDQGGSRSVRLTTCKLVCPLQYFQCQTLRLSKLLDKTMLGLPQSRVTSMSTEHMRVNKNIKDVLRNFGIFERENVFKYERLFTKLININVRCHILREIFYIRKHKIFPFELIPERDILDLEQKISVFRGNFKEGSIPATKIQKEKQNELISPSSSLFITAPITGSIQLDQVVVGANLHPQPSNEIVEIAVIQNMQIVAHALDMMMLDEAIEFYNLNLNEQAQHFKKLLQLPKKSVVSGTSLMTSFVNEAKPIAGDLGGDKSPTSSNILNLEQLHLPCDPPGALMMSNGYLQPALYAPQQAIVYALAAFTSKVLFDSLEIQTRNKGEALVISRDDFQLGMHQLNQDLQNLAEHHLQGRTAALEHQCAVYRQDVLMEKKRSSLLDKKVAFLEQNMLNLVESEISVRLNILAFRMDGMWKELKKLQGDDELKELRITSQVRQNFINSILENELKINMLKHNFFDYRHEVHIELSNFFNDIKGSMIGRVRGLISEAFGTKEKSISAVNNNDGSVLDAGVSEEPVAVRNFDALFQKEKEEQNTQQLALHEQQMQQQQQQINSQDQQKRESIVLINSQGDTVQQQQIQQQQPQLQQVPNEQMPQQQQPSLSQLLEGGDKNARKVSNVEDNRNSIFQTLKKAPQLQGVIQASIHSSQVIPSEIKLPEAPSLENLQPNELLNQTNLAGGGGGVFFQNQQLQTSPIKTPILEADHQKVINFLTSNSVSIAQLQQALLIKQQQALTQPQLPINSSTAALPIPMSSTQVLPPNQQLQINVAEPAFDNMMSQNKQAFTLLQNFQKLRLFYALRLSCMKEKYDNKINSIFSNNSSTDQLRKTISELQNTCDNLAHQLAEAKKTMSLMEYQNEILRRDARLNREEKLKKAFKEQQVKQREIQGIHDKLEALQNPAKAFEMLQQQHRNPAQSCDPFGPAKTSEIDEDLAKTCSNIRYKKREMREHKLSKLQSPSTSSAQQSQQSSQVLQSSMVSGGGFTERTGYTSATQSIHTIKKQQQSQQLGNSKANQAAQLQIQLQLPSSLKEVGQQGTNIASSEIGILGGFHGGTTGGISSEIPRSIPGSTSDNNDLQQKQQQLPFSDDESPFSREDNKAAQQIFKIATERMKERSASSQSLHLEQSHKRKVFVKPEHSKKIIQKDGLQINFNISTKKKRNPDK